MTRPIAYLLSLQPVIFRYSSSEPGRCVSVLINAITNLISGDTHVIKSKCLPVRPPWIQGAVLDSISGLSIAVAGWWKPRGPNRWLWGIRRNNGVPESPACVVPICQNDTTSYDDTQGLA